MAMRRNAKNIATQMTSAPQPQTQFRERMAPDSHEAGHVDITRSG